MRITFLNIPVDCYCKDELLEIISRVIEGGSRIRIEGLNVAKLIQSRNNHALFDALQEAELIHVDGFGIAFGMKLFGISLKNRTAGIDLMIDICERSVVSNAGIFLLGASQDVIDSTKSKLLCDIPSLRISGSRNGYFLPEEEVNIVSAIKNSGAKILFIGMPSPRKELFVKKYWSELANIQIAMGVGGSFDVISGKLKRAPKWMQKVGLEWFFRLIQEPRRLFPRYVITNCFYLCLLIKLAFSPVK